MNGQKGKLRQKFGQNRRNMANRKAASDLIHQRLLRCTEYVSALKPLHYVSVRNEVITLPLIESQLKSGQAAIVPFCQDEELALREIRSLDDLSLGAYGILEPTEAIRRDQRRAVEDNEIDCIVVPGVAFTAAGVRLGHGKGYYDRLFARLSPQAIRIALAFDCQIANDLPQEPHDQLVDMVVTETKTIQCDTREDA